MRTPLHQQVDTLPELATAVLDPFIQSAKNVFSQPLCQSVERVFITGCGDSHHAAVATELAFEQLAGLPCEPMTAMQFSRYAAGYLPSARPASNLVLAVSVSGSASRTVEAMRLGRLAGATAVAVTGTPGSPLAQESSHVFKTTVPPLSDELQGMIVPGSRSYLASQMALLVAAIHLGEQRGHLSSKQANQLRRELGETAVLMEQTIAQTDPIAAQIAQTWHDADQFVFCSAGPNTATAMFTAAKLLEASGDSALAQDTEEWAHLQYFAKQVNTPTFVISAGGWDSGRAAEIVTAAKQIGRRVAVIAPAGSDLARQGTADFVLETAVSPRECFSPLFMSLPGTLFAAYRAQLLDEPYFRDFSGGRSQEGGGGISRIRTSGQLEAVNRD